VTDEFEPVILVDEADRPLRDGGKWQIHKDGLLHRAFSVFVFNDAGECLIQQRANGKYHSAGKWANSCCGHPRPGEGTIEAAERRLEEETGLRLKLTFGFKSRYVAYLDNDMIENEIPYLCFGKARGRLNPDPKEVQAVRWVGLEQLHDEIAATPDSFTAWLRHYFASHLPELKAWRDRL
jgi:isopentenyl-diphosphate delta-isomerase